MIDRIRGKILEKNPAFAIVDVNGLGYQVNISMNTYDKLGGEESVSLFTHLSIREDAHVLYGFHSRDERQMFRWLISVSGVGPSTAMTVLSSVSAHNLQQAIATEDVGLLKKVKGIGPKSAQRIIIDLKDKVVPGVGNFDNFGALSNTVRGEALSALFTLGFDKKTAENAVDSVLKNEKEKISVEDLIKQALRSL